jgi:hypothetical protein
MRRLLGTSLVAGLLAAACSTPTHSGQPSSLPVRYHSEQYGLTLFLPADWKGCSVTIEQLQDETYSPAEDRQIVVGHTPMITLRHPQWQSGSPYQDIRILVFSRAQWDALHRGRLWPSLFAGGIMDELWHSNRFVFAIWSRYNWSELTGGRKVAAILDQNHALRTMPRLYPE